MKLDISLDNDELYDGCAITVCAGQKSLATPVVKAIEIVGRNIEYMLRFSRERESITLTGPMAVWAYLVVFHSVLHKVNSVYYDDGRSGVVLVAQHGPAHTVIGQANEYTAVDTKTRRKPTPAELAEILHLHGMWRRGEGGSQADLRHTDLRGADLSGANLRYADLSDANLSDANLSAADLSGTDLNNADLSGADLSGTNLRIADLRKANLFGANLSGANVKYAIR